jgi:hypothetical protein
VADTREVSAVAVDELIKSLRQLTARDLERLLAERKAEEKAIRTLWRAAVSREREERRQAREASDASR